MGVLALEVIEQATALADQHQQATARVVVLRVGLEMFGEVVDAFAENGDLDFGRSGVGLVCFVAADEFWFCGLC